VRRWLPEDLDSLEHIALALAFGATLLPLVVMILTLLNHSLSIYTAYPITAILIAVNVLEYRSAIKRALGASFRFKLPWESLLALLLFLAIFVFHLLPATGLYVHPGDDPKLYSLITLRIVESGGYTDSWGRYADPNWYHEKIHLIIPGFAGISAYFHLLTSFDIEKTILIMTLVFTSLISLSVYFLTKRIFHSWKAGLFSAFVFGMLIKEPNFRWFSWGGNAEISSLFLLPIQLGLFLHYLDGEDRSLGRIVVIAFLTAGLTILHPFSIFYSLACLIPCTIYFVIKRRSFFKPLEPATAFPLSTIFVLPILIRAFQEELMITPVYSSTPNPFWTPMLSLNQTAVEMLFSTLTRLGIVYGPATFLLLLLCLNEIFHANLKIKTEHYGFLILWAVALLLLHENNPNGLFVIKFPLWYRVDTNRTFTITSFAVSIITGAAISMIMKKNLEDTNLLNQLKRKKLNSVVMILVIALISTQLIANVSRIDASRSDSPVTDADVAAFDWIQENTPADAMFFALPNDAGQWITTYTLRRVIIPFGVATKHEARDEYYKRAYPLFCLDPHHIDVLRYLNDNRATNVYIGSKTMQPKLYPHSANATRLLSSPVYKLVYHDSGVYIFKFLGATFTTLWKDDNFTTGWETGGWPENPIIKSENEMLTVKASKPEGYAYAYHELSIDNHQSFIYLEIDWRTESNTTLTVELTIDGRTYVLIDRGTSPGWTSTVMNINEYARGSVTLIKVLVEGSQHGYVNYVTIKELKPSRQ